MKMSRKLWFSFGLVSLSFLSAEAKLSDGAAMKCISRDKSTRSAFLDLEQAYEMRSVSAKEFFQAFDKSGSCPALRKNLNKLHTDMMAKMPIPTPKSPSFEASAPAFEAEMPATPPASFADDGSSTFFE